MTAILRVFDLLELWLWSRRQHIVEIGPSLMKTGHTWVKDKHGRRWLVEFQR